MKFLKAKFELTDDSGSPYFIPNIWDNQAFELDDKTYIYLRGHGFTAACIVPIEPGTRGLYQNIDNKCDLDPALGQACKLWEKSEYMKIIALVDFLNAVFE